MDRKKREALVLLVAGVAIVAIFYYFFSKVKNQSKLVEVKPEIPLKKAGFWEGLRKSIKKDFITKKK